MHTPSLKFEEEMQFPKVIIVKPGSAKYAEVYKLIHQALFGPLKQLLPELQNF
jgi:hypothetical protein